MTFFVCQKQVFILIILITTASAASMLRTMLLYAIYIVFHFVAITEGPVSVSALIGENTQFHCAAIGADIIVWKADDLFATDIRITDRAIFHTTTVTASGTIQSSLTVPATIENNGTTVQCILYPGEVTSSNATLTVLPGEL